MQLSFDVNTLVTWTEEVHSYSTGVWIQLLMQGNSEFP